MMPTILKSSYERLAPALFGCPILSNLRNGLRLLGFLFAIKLRFSARLAAGRSGGILPRLTRFFSASSCLPLLLLGRGGALPDKSGLILPDCRRRLDRSISQVRVRFGMFQRNFMRRDDLLCRCRRPGSHLEDAMDDFFHEFMQCLITRSHYARHDEACQEFRIEGLAYIVRGKSCLYNNAAVRVS